MTLADILRKVGMPRPSFDALMQRGTLPFMRRVPGQQLHHGHLLALQTYQALRKLGMEARMAGETVNASFGEIMAFAEGAASGAHVGVRAYEDERGLIFHEHIGWPNNPRDVNASRDSWHKVGETSVDLAAVRDMLTRQTDVQAA